MASIVRRLARKSLRLAAPPWHLVRDTLDLWTGRRDRLTPPRRLLFDGTSSYEQFRAIGEATLRCFLAHGLRPTDRVLDVGSGNGKNALALTRYLRDGGSYEGFDVVARGVRWCQARITPRFPHFRFQLADVYNKMYHPDGRHRAAEYRFPFPDGDFDLAFASSVFTHLVPGDAERYLSETARVLRPGGKCFLSFYLLDGIARDNLAAGRCGNAFPHLYRIPECRVADRDMPEAAVAYDDAHVRRLMAAAGLRVESVEYGRWRHGTGNSQDLVWAVRA